MSAALEAIPQAMPDTEVVRRVQNGQIELFEVLMRRHNERLYRALRSIVRDDEGLIEELMQEAYVRAYTHLSDFGGRAQFSTWLIRIGVNEAMSRVRRARLVPMQNDDVATLDVEAPKSDPERATADRQLGELLERAIDQLPDGYREVFVLRQVDGLSVAETAEVLGLTEEAVKTRAHRAHARLRGQLDALLDDTAKGAFRFYAPRCDRVVTAVMARIKR
jgi:RNA polymerase sigma-70 factor (ECF subfamily)